MGARASAAQVKAFISMIAPIAQRQAAAHGNKIFPSVCIAQACCESGYGTSEKMVKANAVFGIKVGNSRYHFGNAWHDKAYSTKTKECYDGKTYTEITDMFRAYDSIEDATCDYFDLLCTASRYRHALNQPTPKACIEGIQKAPYATSPTYVSTIMSIINKQNLTVYDNFSGAAIENTSTDKNAVYEPYSVGSVYVLNSNMYIRQAPGTDAAHVRFEDFTRDGKKHGYADADGNGILKKGTKVTCKAVEKITDGSTWLQIPSGWVCAVASGDTVYLY